MTNFIPTPLDDLPLDRRAEILTLRLRRTEKALHDAEAALLARMIELDQSNRDLRSKEQALSRRLDVESREGIGTRFIIRLPLATLADGEFDNKEIRPGSGLSGKTEVA